MDVYPKIDATDGSSIMTAEERKARVATVVESPSATIAQALERLDKAGTGALAICDEKRKLVGLLTDGDIRRAILKSVPLEEQCGSIVNPQPISALEPVELVEALRTLNQYDIN